MIGEQVIADGTEEFGISETALGLLRTLTEDRCPKDASERLVLHGCGLILMMGCPLGVDWHVEHRGDHVRLSGLIRCDGTGEQDEQRFDDVVDVPLDLYRREVIGLARAVEDFFAKGEPKRLSDSFDRDQYAEFWQEFRERLAAVS